MIWPMLLHLIVILFRLLLMTNAAAAAEASTLMSLTKPGCVQKCGNLRIPYPFGIGDDPNCFLNEDFQLICNTTGDTQLLQMSHSSTLPVLNISLQGQLTTSVSGATKCYMFGGKDRCRQRYDMAWASFANVYRVSDTRNRLTIVGCDVYGTLGDYNRKVSYVGCSTGCLNDTKVRGLPCNGIGCCQTTIPKDITNFQIQLGSVYNFTYTWNISRCGVVVLSDQDDLESQVSHLWDIRNNVNDLRIVGIRSQLVLDWAIRNNNKICEEARRMNNYACGRNTYCSNSTNGPGYLCYCLQGYNGNPYLPDGCQVLDGSNANKTCEKGSRNYACGDNTDCSISNNSPGYICQCIDGFHGNPYLPHGCQAFLTWSSDTRSGCQNKCGNIDIPYPFGLVGDDPTCYKDDEFKLFCNTAVDPPQLTIYSGSDDYWIDHSILNISLEGELMTSIWGAVICNMEATKGLRSGISVKYKFPNTYRLSNTGNRLITVGCNMYGALFGDVGCRSLCQKDVKIKNSSCGGSGGCCQTTIPKDLNEFLPSIGFFSGFAQNWNISRCGFTILSDKDLFASQVSGLWDVRNDVEYLLNIGIRSSMILDWAIRNQTCDEAQRGVSSGYACGSNAYCIDSTNGPGYLCHCLQGYQGNPYLSNGCQALDRSNTKKTCEKGSRDYACGNNTDCSISNNNPGYICHCMQGYDGNPYLPDGCQALSKSPETKPGCQSKCGSVNIPYPFGLVGDNPTCYRDEFKLFCNTATYPPQLIMYRSQFNDMLVLNISLKGQLTFSMFAAVKCYKEKNVDPAEYTIRTLLPNAYRFSSSLNKFTAIGCNTQGVMSDYIQKNNFHIGCISFCPYGTELTNVSCDGIGCCQTVIPKDLSSFLLSLRSFSNEYSTAYTQNISKCSIAFLSDQDWFLSNASNIWNLSNQVDYLGNVGFRTPIILDWAIRNKTCEEAQSVPSDYACGNNTDCTNSINGPGYLCNCKKGFLGNPYLSDGCQDINECEDPSNNLCVGVCTNTIGSYHCSCPKGRYGDGRKDGQGCKSKVFPIIKVIAGISFGILVLLLCISWLYFLTRKRKHMRLKEKFFERNGGLLLQQQLSSMGGSNLLKIFSSKELKLATNNYNQECIIGRGGQGTVYKGVLPNHQVVAIKMSRIMDESRIEQFINEVIILTQINHRNVVKLLGCCLETKVPLLVYEYVSNGTLFHHIHKKNGIFLSWKARLRIATEIASTLAYLHSAVSIPIIHRDIKSTNVLLDENCTAKVSDFGLSKLLPMDRTQITTLVQGTLGYLDPEYFHTGQLTEKSDVYSFGVVLVELLTGETPLSFERSQEQRNLSAYFISSMMENRLFQLIESQLLTEDNIEDLLVVAELAKRCLNVKGEERPFMKNVASELQGLRLEKHPWVQPIEEESMSLLSKPMERYHVPLRQRVGDTSIQSSLEKEMILSMSFPR